ncbi:MAG TPA: NAD(P)H-dependent glycerol-3-phosphate dehydrogenase [Coriobacteriia bacterium]|nr:NAD(P)H-dependent glycerol-3-phosphate dehydrogenase [Coriobacteriia bacterium]
MTNAAVIGAGSWGTAIACVLGSKGVRTAVWARSQDVVDGIASEGRNPRYLSDVALPPSVWATTDLEGAVAGADVMIVATPSVAVRQTASALAELWDGSTPVVSLAKGLERGTLLRMTEVLAEVLGGSSRLAALSGPNHAEEVSLGIPSATVIAAYEEQVGLELRALFSTPSFRAYTNPDVVGVELAGASKNVIAVAAGISDGLGFGDNSKASLMTRGLAEMTRLGRSRGANPMTYMGLAGMGDLIATCTSRHSRNRALGECIARGGSVPQYEAESRMVAEGAFACVTVDELGRAAGLELPITHLVRDIVQGRRSVAEAVGALMGRDATDELHGMDLTGL